MLCTLETSKFNGPTCHVGFVKLYTLKALLKASDKINGVTFSATYIVQPSRKITQFPNIFHALRPVACKVLVWLANNYYGRVTTIAHDANYCVPVTDPSLQER